MNNNACLLQKIMCYVQMTVCIVYIIVLIVTLRVCIISNYSGTNSIMLHIREAVCKNSFLEWCQIL